MKTRVSFLLKLAHEWDVSVQAIAEVGVLRGEFSAKLRQAFPYADLHLVDPWDHIPELAELKGRLHREGGDADANREVWSRTFQRVRFMFAGDEKVLLHRATSAEAAPAFEDNSLDIAYIDADHRYEKVQEDIRLWTPKVRPGAILCGHDYQESGPRRGLFKVKPAVDDMLGASIVSDRRIAMWAWRKPDGAVH